MVKDEIPEREEGGDDVLYLPKRRPRLKKCSQRIDELATPTRRMFLSLWNEHAYHFPAEKVNNLKLLLQRLYPMTPEETAEYFATLRAQARAAARRKKLKQRVRKCLTKKNNEKQKNRAYRMFRKILKRGFRYAVETPVPPLLSIRLRYLSDSILEQLCDLRGLEVPDRTKCDHCGQFLISVADWIAIAAERLYYRSQLAINKISVYDFKTEELSHQILRLHAMGPPLESPSPRHSVQQEKFSSFSQPRVSISRLSEIPRSSKLLSDNEIARRMSEVPKKSFLHEIATNSVNDESDIIEKDPFYTLLNSDSFYQLPVDKDFLVRK